MKKLIAATLIALTAASGAMANNGGQDFTVLNYNLEVQAKGANHYTGYHPHGHTSYGSLKQCVDAGKHILNKKSGWKISKDYERHSDASGYGEDAKAQFKYDIKAYNWSKASYRYVGSITCSTPNY